MTLILPERCTETRRAAGIELRRQADGLVSFRGYASVTEHAYDIYGGPAEGGWSETIARGAFKRTLGTGENRALLYAHDHSRVLATTRSKTLRLSEDSVGLLVEAELDTRSSWVADLVNDIESGRVDEMSIGFWTLGQEWSASYTERRIIEVRLNEATITWAGANGATVATVDRVRDAVAEARSAHTPVAADRRAQIAAAAAVAALRIA